MKALIAILLLTGCQFGTPKPTTPPTDTTICQNAWKTFHLGKINLSPVIDNQSDYTPDLAGWNELGTQVTLRPDGEGFTFKIVEGGHVKSGWLGLASVRNDSSGHIISATVTMNRSLLGKYGPRVAAHVLCQEIGHLFGLGHQPNADDSCMDDCAGRGSGWLACLENPAGTTPNPHDRDELIAIYEHVAEVPPPPPDCATAGTDILIHSFADQ